MKTDGYFIGMKEMSKGDIITELYETHFVENYAFKIAGEIDRIYLEDIVGDLYLIICELPDEFIVNLYTKCGINCFRQYVSGIIIKQIRSFNSKVYRLYKKNYGTTIPLSSIENTDELWAEIEKL
jgi:hypothetical protein